MSNPIEPLAVHINTMSAVNTMMGIHKDLETTMKGEAGFDFNKEVSEFLDDFELHQKYRILQVKYKDAIEKIKELKGKLKQKGENHNIISTEIMKRLCHRPKAEDADGYPDSLKDQEECVKIIKNYLDETCGKVNTGEGD